MSSLRIRGNKYHVMFYDESGKPIERSTGISVKGNNKREAQREADRIVAEYSRLKSAKNKESFTEFMAEWLKDVKGLIKPSTYEIYDKTVNGKLIPYFSQYQYKLKELTPKVFTDYFKFLATNGKSDGNGGLKYKSVKNIKGVLSVMLDYAVENKYIVDNPIKKSKMPAFESELETEVSTYSADEISKLLDYAEKNSSHIYIFLLLECFTGLRKGEIMALTWEDVDLVNGTININKSRTGSRTEVTTTVTTPKTKSSNRVIPINARVVKALTEEKARQKAIDRACNYHYKEVIRNVNGKPYNNLSAINRVVNRLMNNAGLKHCTIHGLRHSVASMLDENGVPIQDISILLGHENISTTEKIYIHRNRKAKVETTNVLDRLINSN